LKINGKSYRSIWQNNGAVQIIDQRHLPHQLVIEDLKLPEDFERAIKDMHVRGAPLIGTTAAFGLYAACLIAPDGQSFHKFIQDSAKKLKATRPTAVDLFYAIERSLQAIEKGKSIKEKTALALQTAQAITEESVENCYQIGLHGFELIKAISEHKKGETVNILTHCNAGWLACVDYGTATAPIYLAHDKGIKLHVWVDETRPRNQGARLTAFELLEHGVPHTVIADNTGGHLMQNGLVDMVITGSDRTTRTGDVANKIGTYLKALAAYDNHIPFYVALPSSSFDWKIRDGIKEIPIEQRNSDEVKYIRGEEDGAIRKVLLTPEKSPAANYAFDVTPARLVTGLITERGVCQASEKAILELFPEKK